jgi:hypothetical protein
MERVVLFIGGPSDGLWMAVPHGGDDQHAIAQVPDDEQHEPGEEFGPMALKHLIYRPTTLTVFGTDYVVHVLDGLPTEQLEMSLTRHLLVPQAGHLAKFWAL